MRNTFNYFSKALSNKVNLLERDSEVGYVQFDTFKTEVAGEFKQKKYLFKKKSFWTGNYDIYREDNNQLIGEIIFSAWKSNAQITLINGETFTMKSRNFWGTQWGIEDKNREVLEFEKTRHFWTNEGTITVNSSDNEKMGLLVLLGVFVKFLYERRAAAASV